MAEERREEDQPGSADTTVAQGISRTQLQMPRMEIISPAGSGTRTLRRTATRVPTYVPTGISVVDRILEYIDERTDGKADWFQRLFSFLAVGGFAALVNLAIFGLLTDWVGTPFLIAELFASEISILTNFALNDRLTFRHLPGHHRSWGARCLRFHVTAIGGTLVTIAVSYALLRLGLATLVAQACAILVALAFNFTFHHLFTYRHTSPAHP